MESNSHQPVATNLRSAKTFPGKLNAEKLKLLTLEATIMRTSLCLSRIWKENNGSHPSKSKMAT